MPGFAAAHLMVDSPQFDVAAFTAGFSRPRQAGWCRMCTQPRTSLRRPLLATPCVARAGRCAPAPTAICARVLSPPPTPPPILRAWAASPGVAVRASMCTLRRACPSLFCVPGVAPRVSQTVLCAWCGACVPTGKVGPRVGAGPARPSVALLPVDKGRARNVEISLRTLGATQDVLAALQRLQACGVPLKAFEVRSLWTRLVVVHRGLDGVVGSGVAAASECAGACGRCWDGDAERALSAGGHHARRTAQLHRLLF
jgi:hypothetical protein